MSFFSLCILFFRLIEIKNQPRWTDPHKIVLDVAPENRDFPVVFLSFFFFFSFSFSLFLSFS